MSSPARVLITRRLPPPAADMLAGGGCAVDALPFDDPPPRELVLERARGVSAVVCTLTERIDDELLDAAGDGLRVVATFAVGHDNIDLALCARRRIRVCNTPGVLTNATADIAWCLILAAARWVVSGDRLVRDGEWRGWTPTQMLGLELTGSTIGVVGAGRIGTAVARRAAGFGMRILYCHPRVNDELDGRLGARRVGLPELLRESDVVTLHIPMRATNRHLLGAEQLATMKATAILVNTARGPIVDEAALVVALREQRIAAAGLDVYEFEPRLTPGLAELPNVVLLPHLGSGTTATRQAMSRMVAENVLAVLSGAEPPNAVC